MDNALEFLLEQAKSKEDKAVMALSKARRELEEQVQNCESYWLDVRKQRRSYEWLIEKKQTEYQRLQEKRDQKMMDEFSTINFNRRRTNTL